MGGERAIEPASDESSEVAGRRDRFDETVGQPGGRRSRLASQDRARRPRRARALWQQDARRGWEHAERDLRQRERRVGGGEDEVTGERQLEAAAQTTSADDGRRRRGKLEPVV